MGTHPIFESDFDCLTVKRMRIVKYGVLCGLIAAESFGTVKSKEAVAAQEAVQKLKENAMHEATDHITDDMRKMEEEILQSALKAQKDAMKNRGAKHHQDNNESEIAQMRMRAA